MYQHDVAQAIQLYVVWAPSDASTVRRFPVTSQEYQRIRDALLLTWFYQKPYRSTKKKRVWTTLNASIASLSSYDDDDDDTVPKPTGGIYDSDDDGEDDEYSTDDDEDDDDDDDSDGDVAIMGMNATRGFW